MSQSPLPEPRTWGMPDTTDKWVPHSEMPWTHYDDTDPPGKTGRHEIVTLGKTIAYVYETNGCEAEDRANAALMLCSPTMFRVCRLLYSAAMIMDDGPDDSDRNLADCYVGDAFKLALKVVGQIERTAGDKAKIGGG